MGSHPPRFDLGMNGYHLFQEKKNMYTLQVLFGSWVMNGVNWSRNPTCIIPYLIDEIGK